MSNRLRGLAIASALVVLVAGCSSSDDASTTAAQSPIATATAITEPVTPEPTATVPPPTPAATATPAPTSTPTPTPTPTPVVEQEPLFELEGQFEVTTNELNEMIRFVEQETGRSFLYPPRFKAITGSGSGVVLEPETDADRAATREALDLQLRRLQALGITSQSAGEATDNWLGLFASGDFAAGVFRAERDIMELPAGTPSFVIVHELVHALDHQHTDLTQTTIGELALETGNYEQATTHRFVVEGRATSVEAAWVDANPVGPDFEAPNVEIPDVPDPLLIGFFLSYSQGQHFIDSRGGAAETWDLLTEPPPATEQLFLTDITDEPVIDVAFPPADGPVLEQRTFGAVDMVLWPVQPGNPAAVARHWGGGASTLWGDDAETCIRIALAGDNPRDLARLDGIYGQWADQDEDRTTVIDGDLLFVTSCAPYVP